REALRLKIYSEALAASQEAMERVTLLTGDLDTAREEADSLVELLDRLEASGFDVTAYRGSVERAIAALDRVELDEARSMIKETFHELGGAAVEHFRAQFESLEKVVRQAKERGFLGAAEEEDMERARRSLSEGQLADSADLLAGLEVRLRNSAAPYVARRVEEISNGFRELPEETLINPVRRLLADADVNLRVKEDLPNSLDSLRRAEREFAAVFAAHASSLVEGLEDERRALESMGGAGDEIQRQIDEVQQIFNMGDFVKASRASQDIRTRAHQQQLVRSEEALSHAKLALVELGKMGLDTVALKSALESAQEAARAQKYPEAYQSAVQVQESSTKLKATAQAILDALGEATELWQSLKQSGLPIDALRERITRAQQEYQALDFETARATLVELMIELEHQGAGARARAMISDVELLVQDCHRLNLPVDAFTSRLADAQALASAGRNAEAVDAIRPLHSDLILHLRPVLEENLRAVERDLEVAHSAGVEVPEVLQSMGEARRRLGMPVPTGVAQLIDRARGEFVETRGFVEHAERGAKRAREALNEAELVHVELEGARQRMDRVEQHLAGKEYPRVIELSSSLERELRQSTHQHVSKTLASFQGSIVRSRQGGTDTTLAENLLHQARGALEEGRPLEALRLATQSESELERVELQLRIAQSSLESVEGKFGASVAGGVRSPSAQEEVEKARAAFQRREYSTVLELAIGASDALSVAREGHRRAREALDSADRQVKEAMEVGADVGEVVGALEGARSHSDAGQYSDATRRAREAAEKARWAIERLYAGTLDDVRKLLETAEAAGVARPLETISIPLSEGEMALKAREWKRAETSLAQARDAAHVALDEHLAARWKAVEELYQEEVGTIGASEEEFRAQAAARLSAESGRHQYAAAFEVIREEGERVGERRRASLQRSVAELKERVWVGEKLGLDTTPAMELLSEASLALESGRLGPVAERVREAEANLARLVAARIPEKFREIQTELVFSQEGLHVTVGNIAEQLAAVESRRSAGEVLEAGRLLLAAEDELNRRKAMHRELMNIHYLIDAALGRAAERHLDATDARKLLDESIRARATDYSVALEKARESLALLQVQLKAGETTPSTYWPFKRTPSDTP
ncbi:MAG: hypothetical protein L3J96_01735, partial [Thermoplasmata archaeon]|nr:hypothetical protein [Thermoplasmata archaeon]